MVDQNKNDDLKDFKDWFLKNNTIQTPYDNPLMFIDGIAGITLYKKQPYQVQLFICEPNTVITEHSHPNIDSYEMFLYGMEFSHKGKIIIDKRMSMLRKKNIPRLSNVTLRIKPNDLHGALSSEKGGAFISIQKWLNNMNPTHVSKDWQGQPLGDKHKIQLDEN
tara:strand:- start:688 stop:1179 length:492 start_codon:yes stop_codon:yes gene_type:complete